MEWLKTQWSFWFWYILVAAALSPGIFRLAPTPLNLTGFSSHRMGNSITSSKFRTPCRKGEGGLPACLSFMRVFSSFAWAAWSGWGQAIRSQLALVSKPYLPSLLWAEGKITPDVSWKKPVWGTWWGEHGCGQVEVLRAALEVVVVLTRTTDGSILFPRGDRSLEWPARCPALVSSAKDRKEKVLVFFLFSLPRQKRNGNAMPCQWTKGVSALFLTSPFSFCILLKTFHVFSSAQLSMGTSRRACNTLNRGCLPVTLR